MHPASILVTDDESNIRMMVRTALESDGCTCWKRPMGARRLKCSSTAVRS